MREHMRKNVTCTGVGLGGCGPRRFSYLAEPLHPSGLGCTHISSCAFSDPEALCPLAGSD